MGNGTAIGQVHGHAVTPPGPSSALPIVSRERGHVAHEHRVEFADVHAQFEGRRTDEGVDGVRFSLEQVFEAFSLLVGNHRRVLLGAKHRITLVQNLQVVVVRIFRDKLDFALAAPCGAFPKGRLTDCAAPATSATPNALIAMQAEPVRIHLVNPADARQGSTLGSLEPNGLEHAELREKAEQLLKELFGVLRQYAPLPRHLPDRRIAPIAEPLGHELRLFVALATQLGPRGVAEARQVPLLYLEVAFQPIPGENLLFRVVQDALAAEVIEQAGHSFVEFLGSESQSIRCRPG